MPYRNTPLVVGEIYHVFNRSIARQLIFKNQKDHQRIIDVINFYRFNKLPLRYSHYSRLSKDHKSQFDEDFLINSKPILNIIAYCIMPNHFHFLLQPVIKNGISDFMRNVQNSYSKYYNTKYERTGSLFQSMFKAVRIETNEQLLHVCRYIHLNPVTAYLLEIDRLVEYPWSSFRNYLLDSQNESFVSPELVLDQFKSREIYKKFVFDQEDYQRKLDGIRHLVLE